METPFNNAIISMTIRLLLCLHRDHFSRVHLSVDSVHVSADLSYFTSNEKQKECMSAFRIKWVREKSETKQLLFAWRKKNVWTSYCRTNIQLTHNQPLTLDIFRLKMKIDTGKKREREWVKMIAVECETYIMFDTNLATTYSTLSLFCHCNTYACDNICHE